MMISICILGLIDSELQSLRSHTQTRHAAWDLFLNGSPDVLWRGTSQCYLSLRVESNLVMYLLLFLCLFSFNVSILKVSAIIL